MDIYAGNYRKKCISFPSVYAHGMQMVIIQDAVIYPFVGCSVFIDFYVFPCTPGNGRVKARVPAGFCVDAPPVWGFGSFIPACAGIRFIAGQRAAPFAPAAAGAVALVYNSVTGLADRGSLLINCNFTQNGFWPATVDV